MTVTSSHTSQPPKRPKDDMIDIFARRENRDRLPGFVFAAAPGSNWQKLAGQDNFVPGRPGLL